jgi:hypothetical protein
MTSEILLTFGQGVKTPQGARTTLPRSPTIIAAALNDLEGHEAWWSPHLWTGDYRAQKNWERLGALVVDIDHHDVNGAHAACPPEVTAELAKRLDTAWAGRWSIWHSTPRGARLVWILSEDSTSAKDALECQQLACNLAAVLVEGLAGLQVDVKASKADLARLYYLPRASTDSGPRTGVAFVGREQCFSRSELDALAHAVGRPAAQGGRPSKKQIKARAEATNAVFLASGALTDVDLSAALEARPAEGPGDGSLELVSLARFALGLGITDAERFVRLSGPWNAKRRDPWSDEDRAKRFVDAAGRWESEGLAVGVPVGRYTTPGLEKILHEDRLFKGLLSWNVIEDAPVFGLGEGAVIVDDSAVRRIEAEICRRYGWPSIPKDSLWISIEVEARQRLVDPIADYLLGLTWDGVPRLAELPARLKVTAPDHVLAAQYLTKALIAAVARALAPGCKHDHVPVLVGPDRAKKSSFIRALAGQYFSDAAIDLESKDGLIGLKGVWLYEWSEIDGVTRRADLSRLKSYVSSQQDRYRPPYARSVVKQPRRCAFWGTSNTPEILHDPSSNRRFWVLEVGRGIELEWVVYWRDQLWAEAVTRYAFGETWWLDEADEERREAANAEYETHSDLEEQLARVFNAAAAAPGFAGYITSRDLVAKMGLDATRTNSAVFSRLNSLAGRLGWVRRMMRLQNVLTRVWQKR